MQGYHVFTVLIMITTVLIYLNYKLFRLPVTIAITLFSLFLSLLLIVSNNYIPQLNQAIKDSLDDIKFDEIVMNILLGFLLFGAAFRLNVLAFRKHLKLILALAFLSTICSTFIVGALVYFCFTLFSQPIPFINCLLFGALISPTDPVAAVGILGKVGIAKKLELQITGESLVNDGIAIVIFTTLLTMATTNSNDSLVVDTLTLFLREAGGALLFGFALGFVAKYLLKWIANYKLEILVTLSIVTGGYTLALMLEISAPLAIVIAGLICSVGDDKNKGHISHQFVLTFWELVEDLINIMLFLLIGLGVFVISIHQTVLLIGFITVILVIMARYLSLLPVYGILHSHFEKHTLELFTWAALRGAVSIALALSLPYTLNRSEFLAITYLVAVFSIIVQGLTIKPVAQKLGF